MAVLYKANDPTLQNKRVQIWNNFLASCDEQDLLYYKGIQKKLADQFRKKRQSVSEEMMAELLVSIIQFLEKEPRKCQKVIPRRR